MLFLGQNSRRLRSKYFPPRAIRVLFLVFHSDRLEGQEDSKSFIFP